MEENQKANPNKNLTKTFAIRTTYGTVDEFTDLMNASGAATAGSFLEALLENFVNKSKPTIKEVSKQADLDRIQELTNVCNDLQQTIDDQAQQIENLTTQLAKKGDSSAEIDLLQEKIRFLEANTPADDDIIIHPTAFQKEIIDIYQEHFKKPPEQFILNLFIEQVENGPNEMVPEMKHSAFQKLVKKHSQPPTDQDNE
ncbi:MAG: hypothetical protein PHS33_08490 [Candidatus Omnitrophica bacterium]|nr:hypothetical protein [Candidatus Omnitrophota bacterium]